MINKYFRYLLKYFFKYPQSLIKAPIFLIENGVVKFNGKLSDIISLVEDSYRAKSILPRHIHISIYFAKEIFALISSFLFYPKATLEELKTIMLANDSGQDIALSHDAIAVIVTVSNVDSIHHLEAFAEILSDQINDRISVFVSVDTNAEKRRLEEIRIIAKKYNLSLVMGSDFAQKKQFLHSKYVLFAKLDVKIKKGAILTIRKYLTTFYDAEVFYSDSEIQHKGQEVPLFKPGYSPDLLLSQNYFGNFIVIKREILHDQTDYLQNLFDLDYYDLLLKLTKKHRKIIRIPKILYSQKKIVNENQKIYVEKALQERGAKNFAVYSSKTGNTIEYLPTSDEKVSIIIPTKDRTDLLRVVVESVLEQDYKNIEIIIVNNNSSETDTINYFKQICSNKLVRVIEYPKQFNISKIFNFAVEHAAGDLILLLNNDIESIDDTWLTRMVGQIQRKDIGGVGVKLLYPNRKIQHAGVVLGLKNKLNEEGVAGHIYAGLSNSERQFHDYDFFNLQRNWSAVTGACFITRKDLYLQIGGFDEDLRVLFSDIDFCLQLGKNGKSIVYDPSIVLLHHESVSVKKIRDEDLRERRYEIQYFRRKWSKVVDNDPFYNPNLSLIGTQADVATELEISNRTIRINHSYPHISKYLILYSKLGLRGILNKIRKRFLIKNIIDSYNIDYTQWIESVEKPDLLQLARQNIKLSYQPKISILVPTHNTKLEWLEKMISSLSTQIYENWELCIADDGSNSTETLKYLKNISDKKIHVTFLKSSRGISAATNAALGISTGEYIGLLDHDDELAPHALYEVVSLLNEHPEAEYIYSDEDKLDFKNRRCDPFFKPDWSPDYFLSSMYTAHFSVVKKTIAKKVGGFRSAYDGSQDYDFILRVAEATKNIFHIPKILYHWRKTKSSTSYQYSAKSYAHNAAEHALRDAIGRRRIDAIVEGGIRPDLFRIRYEIKENPLVSIIIPTRNSLKYLKTCVSSVLSATTYDNYEIIIVDNQSDDENTKRYLQRMSKHPNIRVILYLKPFNYSKINNYAVKEAIGDYVILLNNDIEIISNNWVETLLEYAQQRDVGAVGLKLVYPNNEIQHCGIVLGIAGMAGHPQKHFPDIEPGQLPIFNTKDVTRNWLAVTAACLMIQKSKYLEIGGMDPEFEIAFNDVDFCLRLHEGGYKNIYTPYAKLIHYESISVKNPKEDDRDTTTLLKEIALLNQRWGKYVKHDPYYNPNLTLAKEDFSIK